MTKQSHTYALIAHAIGFIQENFKDQPSLDQIAQEVGLSPFHFQRLFQNWAGVSPKKFIQYMSLTHAKKRLEEQESLLAAAYDTGLSGSSRLHDLFVSIEAMTPGTYKKGGEGLDIDYLFTDSPFGPLIIAATPKGICHIHFEDDRHRALENLQQRYPHATYHQRPNTHHGAACAFFQQDWDNLSSIKLHLQGSAFQLKVWESLLKIPTGAVTTYGQLAQQINQPKAARAVGSAIAKNPIAVIIPCHRVIQNSGKVGGYMWGPPRKTALLGWEAAHAER